MFALQDQPHKAEEPEESPLKAVVQRLVREHRSWRVKDFPMIQYLFDSLWEDAAAPPPACLASLRKAFYRLRAEMEGHMNLEETVLFPAIVEGSAAIPAGAGESHADEGELLGAMREAAHGYRLPETADEKLRILFKELQALEAAMHAHSRLESSILFARTLNQ